MIQLQPKSLLQHQLQLQVIQLQWVTQLQLLLLMLLLLKQSLKFTVTRKKLKGACKSALFCFKFAWKGKVPLKKLLLILLMLVPVITTVNADTPVGSGPGFTMSPNPVTGNYFYINLSFSESEYPNTLINITNVLGQVIYSYPIRHVDFANRQVRIDLNDAKLDKGVYFVQLKSGESTKTQKLAVR
jgi:Secretion system C-terminal sorting domain